MKLYNSLTKQGIVVFVLFSGMAGYALSLSYGMELELWKPILLGIGLYFVSSGSFALNQAQEWQRDQKMGRTEKRPIPAGVLSPWQAYMLGTLFSFFGLFLLFLVEPISAYLAVATIALYNGLYTLLWKRSWVFAAVPGAIPGAMPVLIGFAVNQPHNLLSPSALYLFLIMFLWQMPHFWCLAIRFKDDYERGGFPVLPTKLGIDRTLYHIGLYVFAYVGVALAAPLFVQTSYLHVLLVIPFALKVVWEFFKFFNAGTKKWLPFFLWVNLSMLVFLVAPVFDKWIFYLVQS